jgi:hypothetical protein
MADPMDLIVVNDDGTYRVAKSDWLVKENKIDKDDVGDAAVLVKRGAIFADIPVPEIPIGYYCFLINLAQLASARDEPNLDVNVNVQDPDLQSLIVHVLPDQYYVVHESLWKQNKDPSLPPATDSAICAERPDGFLVNLPRIRNKK